MSQRKKLIELVAKALDAPNERNEKGLWKESKEHISDYLIANGVVVLPYDDKTWLAMRAGARAIRTNKRLDGTIYCYDPFGESKEISYLEAEKILCEIADVIPEEKERALTKRKGGDE